MTYPYKNIVYSNRGMTLEYLINASNAYYRMIDKAIIYKKPTPITVAKVDYKSRFDAKIKEAYYRIPSTTDYNGIYKGKYIDFEAKETMNKTSFPLSNIHKHQIDHIESIIRHNGIAFIIVYFKLLNKIYYLKGEDLIIFIKNNKRKSIPLDYFNLKGYLLIERINPFIDYLKIIDELYFKENYNEESI